MFHLTGRHQVLWFSNISNILLSRGAWKLGLFLFSPYGAAHLNPIQYPYDFTISPLQWIGYIYIHMVDQAQRGQQPETFAELLMNLRLLWFRLVQPTPPLLPHPCKSSIAPTASTEKRPIQSKRGKNYCTCCQDGEAGRSSISLTTAAALFPNLPILFPSFPGTRQKLRAARRN